MKRHRRLAQTLHDMGVFTTVDRAALADYATRARDISGDVGQALVGAFQSAESAVGEFVKSGKLDFRDLMTSVIADLA